MSPPHSISTVAIVGGGVSGCLVAVQLLGQTQPLRVMLFERMTDIGRGVAYGTENHDHLLNVPVERMSAFVDAPDHFLHWATARSGQPGYPASVTPGDFLPRWIFGDYVQDVLGKARAGASAEIEFVHIKGEVVDIEENAGEVRISTGDGRFFTADRVVLAIGNLPGEYPIRKPLPAYHSQRYVHVPWRPGTLAGIPPEADVLIVGAGLTAIDIVLDLQSSGHTGTVHALSRRGLLPIVHKKAAPYPSFLSSGNLPTRTLDLFRQLRAEVRKAAAAGVDWRPVLDAIRPQAMAIWQGLSWEERARFMRHVRPFWDIHRHRLAPPVAEKIETLRQSGRLKFYAARLIKLTENHEGIEAQFRLRRTGVVETVKAAKVINCTGPRSDYSKYQHPLLINLLARGLIDHDPLALGLNTLPDGRVLRYRNGPVGWLFTLGAPIKGTLWECTAVPEIRGQAASVAREIISSLDEEMLGHAPQPIETKQSQTSPDGMPAESRINHDPWPSV